MPVPPPKEQPPNPELMKQISAAWDDARAQLAELKEAVDRNAQMAQLKMESAFLHREKDQALRDFGEAVWGQVMRGKLQLPVQLNQAVRLMIDLEKKIQKQAEEINDILKEGDEAADRLRQKRAARPAPPLASKMKKR